jgi:type IV secretion system protein VirB2
VYWVRPGVSLFTLLILFPTLALAQSPFDTGFTAMQTLFTGTVAKVASLIAIVVGGYQFAHGEPGAKKTLAGVAAGTGINDRPVPGRSSLRVIEAADTPHTRLFECSYAVTNRAR